MNKLKFLFYFFLFFQIPIFGADGYHNKFSIQHCPESAKTNHSEWQNYINKHLNDNERFKFSWQQQCTMSKQELLDSNYEIVNFLYTTMANSHRQLHVFSKECLHSFCNLPENTLEKLKDFFSEHRPRSPSGHEEAFDARIKFRYKKKLSLVRIGKAIVKNYAIFASLFIPTILNNYSFLLQRNQWALIQPPSLLAENKKKEFTNEIIRNLCKKKQINDELISLHTISPVEFKWILLPDDDQLTYYWNKISTKLYPLLIHKELSILFNKRIFNMTSKSYNYTPDCDTNKCQPDLQDRYYSFFTLYNCQLFIIGVFGEPLTSLIFAHGTSIGLIITGCLPIIISIIQTTIDLYAYHNKTIECSKKKFLHQNNQWTFKEILEYYINKENIV